MTALLAAGCASVEPLQEQADTLSQSYASGVFGDWSSSPPTNTGGFTDSMGVCATSARYGDASWDGMLIVGRHASGASANRFRYGMYAKARGWLAWPNLGTATFNSKPVCTMLNNPNTLPSASYWSNQVALVGKRSSDNRYAVRIMQLGTATGGLNVPPNPPSFPVDWHTISTDAYASAPFVGVEFGCLLVGGRTSETTPNHSHIYFHLNCMTDVPNQLPVYSSSNWEPRIVLPALPAGWSAVGDPAMTTEGDGIAYIVTRAQNSSGQTRLYYANIFVPWLPLQGQLVNGYDGGPVSWTHIPNGLIPVNSDPSIEFDTTRNELTVYYRGGNLNRIFQSTRTTAWTWPAFAGIHNNTFGTAPAATANVLADWSHIVIARTSENAEQVWFSGIDPRALE